MPLETDPVFPKSNAQASAGSDAAPFDFRRPDRIAKSQIRAIQVLHENFARSLTLSLSAYLRSWLTVSLVSVEQVAYGEFIDRLPSPTCLVSVSLRPWDGHALLELNSSLIFPIIEIILGGKGTAAGTIQREVTEIEQHLLDAFFRIVLKDLREAWKSVTPIEFEIDALATEPPALQILARTEPVVAIALEIRIGENSGTLNLAIPSGNIRAIGYKFDQQRNLRKTEPSEAGQQQILKLIRTADAEFEALLRGPSLRVGDLLSMEPGDLMRFEHRLDQTLEGEINGTVKFHGRVIGSNEKKAFLIDVMPEARS